MLGRMGRGLLGAIYGEARSLKDFQGEARRYVQIQRTHVLRENRELLPLAEILLTPEDDQTVVQGFARLESGGPDEPRRIFQRIEALCTRLDLGTTDGTTTRVS